MAFSGVVGDGITAVLGPVFAIATGIAIVLALLWSFSTWLRDSLQRRGWTRDSRRYSLQADTRATANSDLIVIEQAPRIYHEPQPAYVAAASYTIVAERVERPRQVGQGEQSFRLWLWKMAS